MGSTVTTPAEVHAGVVTEIDSLLTERTQVETLVVADARVVGPRGFQLASVPAGRTLQSLKPFLDEMLERPLHRVGKATLVTERSFHQFVERFLSARHTVLFADPSPTAPTLTAIFDYHTQGPVEEVGLPASAAPGAAEVVHAVVTGHSRHRAVLALRTSDEWKAWHAIHGKPMTQPDFTAFLQDRMSDLILVDSAAEPSISAIVEELQARLGSPQQIMALARGLEVRSKRAIKNVSTLESGEMDISFQEEHTDASGAKLTIPTLFFITIPVFYAGEPYRIPVRIRYRLDGVAVIWSLHLYRQDRVFDHAFTGAVRATEAATGLVAMLGTPEQ